MKRTIILILASCINFAYTTHSRPIQCYPFEVCFMFMRPMRVRAFRMDIKKICNCKYSCLPFKPAYCMVYLFSCVMLYIIIFINICVLSNIIYLKEYIYLMSGTTLYIYVYFLYLYIIKYKIIYDNLVTFQLNLSQIIYLTYIAHTLLVYNLRCYIPFNAQLFIQTKHIHCIPTSNLLYQIINLIFYNIIYQFAMFIRYKMYIFLENTFAGTTERIFLNLMLFFIYIFLVNTLFK